MKKQKILGAVVLCVGVALGVCGVQYYHLQTAQAASMTVAENQTLAEAARAQIHVVNPDKSLMQLSDFPVNENGETYGSAMYAELDAVPDLVLARGDNGVEGYLRAVECAFLLDPNPPKSPEEAIARQEAEQGKTFVYNVYALDGVTVVDTFTLNSGSVPD